MSARSEDGVVDPYCRVWDVPDLLVTDGACWPSCGWQNPTLHMMARSFRTTCGVRRRLVEVVDVGNGLCREELGKFGFSEWTSLCSKRTVGPEVLLRSSPSLRTQSPMALLATRVRSGSRRCSGRASRTTSSTWN